MKKIYILSPLFSNNPSLRETNASFDSRLRLTVFSSVLLLSGSIFLTGCDSLRNTFGLDHSSPNEYAVDPGPGLILPPDFADRPKLPAPSPGAPNPHAVPDTVKAQKTVLGDTAVIDSSSSSKGEQELVEKASEKQEITPDIRQKVDEEAQEENTVSGKIISKIKSWKREAKDNLGLSNTPETSSDDNTQKTDSKAGDKPTNDDMIKDKNMAS